MNHRSGDTTALRSSKSANGGRALPIINAVVWASKRTLMSFSFLPLRFVHARKQFATGNILLLLHFGFFENIQDSSLL
ncbi:hypothetical protein SADUNF_Sadunf07G0087200 [Salix dunnii]|uniref:Uncharacterized protein n=1 Tax=Salix dunnii TaxID=1413687 RepID=A0A835K3V9_9ROSI|nr:hypothetical protein SADUNF_Sadunf07G0087200 [Salix dunnii]